jgi:hypothetical protein
MSMHLGYPELVKTALASDVYWQAPSEELALEPPIPFGPSERRRLLKERLELMQSSKMAHEIGSVFHSLDDSGSIEPIPYGEQLPATHPRQVIKVVEDSRQIIGKLSALNLLDFISERRISKLEKEAEREDPDYTPPIF